MSELPKTVSIFRDLERDLRERGQHLDLLYAELMDNMIQELETEEDDEYGDMPVIREVALEIVEAVSLSSHDSNSIPSLSLHSISSWHSDSGFGASKSSQSLFSEFSSLTSELRHNEGCHFGFLVRPEHVIPDIGRDAESQSQDPVATSSNQLYTTDRYTAVLNEQDGHDSESNDRYAWVGNELNEHNSESADKYTTILNELDDHNSEPIDIYTVVQCDLNRHDGVSDNRYTAIINELDDQAGELADAIDEIDGANPVRRRSSETRITRSRKRKRDSDDCVLKSASDMCINDSFKKRRLI